MSKHLSKFYKLLIKDGTAISDKERQSLFWILSNNDDLYSKIDHIYNFKEHVIKTECIGYTQEELDENREMGEEWMDRCSICELPLEENEYTICSYCESIPDFCSSSRSLIKLGFNLYNGFCDEKVDVLSTLSYLDSANFEIALKAIKIRFGYFSVFNKEAI